MPTKTSTSDGGPSLSNQDIVTIALFAVGGDSHAIDTEDIAVKANQIAPGRFCWRKYSDQINIDTVRKRLWDARREERGCHVTGSEKDGWMLTESGAAYAKAKASLLTTLVVGQRRSLTERRWLRDERARIENSEVIAKVRAHGADTVSRSDAEAVFRLNDYIVGRSRQQKIARLLNAFADDLDLAPALSSLAAKLRENAK